MTDSTERHTIKNTTRGGQVFLHNLRMMGQVFIKVVLWTLPLVLMISLALFYLLTDLHTRSIGQEWMTAQYHDLMGEPHFQQVYPLPTGQSLHISSNQIRLDPQIQQVISQLKQAAFRSMWMGTSLWGVFILGVLSLLYRSGRHYTQSKPLKGDYLGSTPEIKRLMEKNDCLSDWCIGKEALPIPKLAELQHFLVHGTTGSGKSTVIKAMLDEIRRRGDRAIIYDKSCNLVSQFYHPESDQLLNPLDQRGVAWGLWEECRDKSDFENLAAALIPMAPNAQDPFWINAARTIFAAAAYRMRSESNPQLLALLRYLLTADIGDLQNLLKGTEAESLMSEKTEKTAISIKSVLATYLKSLCYLTEGDAPFSIRQWIQNEEGKSWLFISSLGDRHESLKPLITAWLDIAVNALLSLPESPERRIWVILDELGSLQQLPYLTAALSEARKFGGCFVVGIQSYAQLAKMYGFEGGREISSLLNTRFLFRTPDPEIAQWSSKSLGETTLEEVKEGISYGANTIRDGVSIQKSERQKLVIPASEIMRLNDLNCYVRLAGAYPIVKIEMPYVSRVKLQEGFLLRVYETDNLGQEIITTFNDHPAIIEGKQHYGKTSILPESNHTQDLEKLLN